MARPRQCDHPRNGARTCIPCAQSRWRCDHPRTPKNARPDGTCRKCGSDKERLRRLPEMLDLAILRVEGLRAEMKRRGIDHPNL